MSVDATLFKNLQAVTSKIHATDNIDEIILDLSKDICAVFEADRLTIYTVNEDRSSIISKVKTGLNTVKELKLPVGPEFSVAGYVAQHKKQVNIKDAYDDRELASFDPPVRFLKEVDKHSGYRTRQMLVAPILEPRDGDLLGVVQIINHRENRPFPKVFEEAATELCRTLGIAFRQRTVRKPAVRSKFEFLVVEGLMSTTQFDLATAAARQREIDLEEYLRSECRMKDKELGEALSRYYRVPYELFRADRSKPEELLKRLKREYWEKCPWLPLEDAGDTTIVLTADPHAASPREVASLLGKYKVEFRVCTRREFQDTKQLYFSKPGLDIKPDEVPPEEEKPPVSDEPSESDNEIRRIANKIIVDAKTT
ncbi:MAG: GAF domain-containing protein, partial [Betaproteobacteria bacterium]|nr:GAF domain-containing protein [Betaproteobacteria bacterium]